MYHTYTTHPPALGVLLLGTTHLPTHLPTPCVQLLSELHDAAAAAAEHLAELQGRVAAKEEGIAAQRAALQKKARGEVYGCLSV